MLANRLRVLLERGEFRMVQEDPQFYRSVVERVR